MKTADIFKVAKVARIKISQDEAERYQKKLDSMIPWFHNMLATEVPDFIKPVYSMVSQTKDTNISNDEVKKENKDALYNVSSKQENAILVPKVI